MKNAVRELRPRGTPDFALSLFRHNVEQVSVKYHWHPEIELVYVEKGSFNININQKSYLAQPGDIYFINSGELHEMNHIAGQVRFESVVFFPYILDFDVKNPFQRSFIDPIKSGEVCLPHRIDQNDDCYDAVREQVGRILSAGNDEFSKSQQLVALYELILILFREKKMYSGRLNKTDARNSEIIKNITAYIEENLGDKITLSQLAQIPSFTEKYFCSFFKKQTGVTPTEYINRVRLERACELMRMHAFSVTDAAFETGFESLSYFIRRFKKQFGISPAQYKKQFSKTQKQ